MYLRFFAAAVIGIFICHASATEQSCRRDGSILSAYNQILPLEQSACFKVFDSPDCQRVYKEIESAGNKIEDFAIRCDHNGLNAPSIFKVADVGLGCAVGGWEFVKNAFIGLGTGIGNFAGYVQISAEKEKALNEICDKSLETKKNIYLSYNRSVKKELQVKVPSDADFNRKSCAFIKTEFISAREQKKRWHMQQNPREYIADYSHDFNIVEAAKKVLREKAIQVECYNAEKASALICEALAPVALTAGAMALKHLAGISRSSVTAESSAAQSSAASTTTSTAANATRVQRAESILNRKLNPDEILEIDRIHKIGRGELGPNGRPAGVGNYTQKQKLKKARALKKMGITDKDKRRLLFEEKVVGDEWIDDAIRLEEEIAQMNNKMLTTKTSAETKIALQTLREELDKILDANDPDITDKIAILKVKLKELQRPQTAVSSTTSTTATSSALRVEDIAISPHNARGVLIPIQSTSRTQRYVQFSDHALTDFAKAEPAIRDRLTQSLKNGLSAENIDQSKVKLLLGSVNPGPKGKGFEVRITNRGHQRLLGCFKDGIFLIVKYDPHAPEDGAGYNKYNDLCK